MALPRTAADWAAFTGYCGLIVLGHLANGHGMRHTPAGPGAILMATELPFAYLIDVALVGEPTNALAAAGVAVVFAGVACATAARAAPKVETAPLRAARASDGASHLDDGAVQHGHGAEAWVAELELELELHEAAGGREGEPPPRVTPQRNSTGR